MEIDKGFEVNKNIENKKILYFSRKIINLEENENHEKSAFYLDKLPNGKHMITKIISNSRFIKTYCFCLFCILT